MQQFPNAQWTDERTGELKDTDNLLDLIIGLNHGSDFLGNVAKCIDISQQLRDKDFTEFLRDLCIEDRLKS